MPLGLQPGARQSSCWASATDCHSVTEPTFSRNGESSSPSSASVAESAPWPPARLPTRTQSLGSARKSLPRGPSESSSFSIDKGMTSTVLVARARLRRPRTVSYFFAETTLPFPGIGVEKQGKILRGRWCREAAESTAAGT